MEITTINKVRKVEYVAVNFVTGISDFVVTVRKPDGSVLSTAPTVTEQQEGTYTFSYTPDVVGLWQEKIESATNGDKAIRNVDVKAVDVDDLKSLQDTINGKVDVIDGVVDGIDTKVDTVDGKIDDVDTKVDTVQSAITTVDGKADSIETKVDSLDTKITSIDNQVNPGGKFL